MSDFPTIDAIDFPADIDLPDLDNPGPEALDPTDNLDQPSIDPTVDVDLDTPEIVFEEPQVLIEDPPEPDCDLPYAPELPGGGPGGELVPGPAGPLVPTPGPVDCNPHDPIEGARDELIAAVRATGAPDHVLDLLGDVDPDLFDELTEALEWDPAARSTAFAAYLGGTAEEFVWGVEPIDPTTPKPPTNVVEPGNGTNPGTVDPTTPTGTNPATVDPTTPTGTNPETVDLPISSGAPGGSPFSLTALTADAGSVFGEAVDGPALGVMDDSFPTPGGISLPTFDPGAGHGSFPSLGGPEAGGELAGPGHIEGPPEMAIDLPMDMPTDGPTGLIAAAGSTGRADDSGLAEVALPVIGAAAGAMAGSAAMGALRNRKQSA